MNKLRGLLLLAALMLVPAQSAWAGGLDGRDGGTDPFFPVESDGAEGSDTDSPEGEEECIDWDVEMGQQCPNDFPGETEDTGPEDTGPEDTGGGDSGPEDTGGPDVTVESCEPDCVILGDGTVVWFDEETDDSGVPGGETGGTGDTGSLTGAGNDWEPRPMSWSRGVISARR